MSIKAVNSQHWLQAWRKLSGAAAQDDPAEMGTAFGLDQSLTEAPPAPAAAPERRSGWVRRASPGRRAAT